MTLPRRDIVTKSLQSFILGTCAPLAFSPYDIYIIAVISPALLIHIWLGSSPRSALIYGYVYGLGMFGVGISWLHISIYLFGGVNLAGSVLLTFLFVMFIALFPALAGYVSAKLSGRQLPQLSIVLIIPAVWTLSEWIRSWIFTGFPWLNLGYSQIDSPLNGLAPIFGVFGISYVVLFTAASFAVLFRMTGAVRYTPCALVLLLWGAAWLAENHHWTAPTGEKITVALIQGAIPQELKWTPEMRQPTLDIYRELTGPYLDHDLIIWPEAAIPAYYHQIETDIQQLLAKTSENDTRLITGLPVMDRSTGKYYNSVVMLDQDVSFYYKRHLVPFGEYLPFAFVLQGFVDYFNIPMSDFSRGTAPAPVISTRDFDIGISICYEDTFGEEVIQALPQAAILVNVSNDAWFGDSAAPHQHLQMARMRASETGRYLLRATNTGITAIIDEKGNILDRSPQFTPVSLSGEATLFSGSTPYVKSGNYPVIILSFLILSVLGYKRSVTN